MIETRMYAAEAISTQTLEGYKDFIELFKSEAAQSLTRAEQVEIDFTHHLVLKELRHRKLLGETGRVLKYTGLKADEVRDILLQDNPKRQRGVIEAQDLIKNAFFRKTDVKKWSNDKLFAWLEGLGYKWTDGQWSLK